MDLPIANGVHKEEQNEGDQGNIVQLFGQCIVVVLFGQIVAADHEIGHNVAERGEHQERTTSEQVDRVSAQPGKASKAKIDFFFWVAIINFERKEN